MKWNTSDFLRKCQHPALYALGSIPLLVLLVMNAAPQALGLSVLLDGLYLACAWFCLITPGRIRLAVGGCCAGALTGAGIVLLPIGEAPLLVLLVVLYVTLLFLSLPMAAWPREREVGTPWICIGALANVLVQLFINVDYRTGQSRYLPAEPLLLVCFLGYVALVLLAFNRASMESAGQSRRGVPTYMRRINVVLTIGLLGISVLVAAIPAIGSALGKAWSWLLDMLLRLGALLAALLPQRTSGQGGAPAPMDSDSLSLGEANEPSLLAVIMEKMISVIALVALLALIVFVVWKLYVKLRELLGILLRRLSQYSAAASDDYEDEITDTREDGEHEGGLFYRRRSRVPKRDESIMSPAEKVRYRYLRLMARHRWQKASTARETLPAEAASLYEQARYSNQPLTDAQASQFREKTRQL